MRPKFSFYSLNLDTSAPQRLTVILPSLKANQVGCTAHLSVLLPLLGSGKVIEKTTRWTPIWEIAGYVMDWIFPFGQCSRWTSQKNFLSY